MWGKLSALGAKVSTGGANGASGGLSGEALNDALDVAVNADAVLDLFSQAATSADRATVLSCALERLMVAHTRVAERHVQQLLLAISSSSGDDTKDEIYQATNVLLACVQSQPNKDIIQRRTESWLESQEELLIQRESEFSSSPVEKLHNNSNKSNKKMNNTTSDNEEDEVLESTSVQELIVACLPDDADCLLNLITSSSTHGFWVRYTVTQLLRELVAADHLSAGSDDPFLNLLLRSTCGVGSMVELLDDTSNDGILRAEGLSLLLAFATKVYSTVEFESHVQDLFTFENLFDRLFAIIKESGGSASQDTSAVAVSNDCAQIVCWLVTVSIADSCSSGNAMDNLEDDAETAAAEHNAAQPQSSAGDGSGGSINAVRSNEKVISFFLKMDHVKALVPCLHAPATELGKEVVLHGLRTLDSVLRVALQPSAVTVATNGGGGGKRPRTPRGIVDPHSFRPSLVSSKVFPSLCALLPLHTMLTGNNVSSGDDGDSEEQQKPSVVLLNTLLKDRRKLSRSESGQAQEAEGDEEEALCLLVRCLLLITEECPSGREHLLHPSSPVFPMLTIMATSSSNSSSSSSKSSRSDSHGTKGFTKSSFLALGLLLQLLGYMDSTRGSAPQTMLDMVVRGLIDVLNTVLPKDEGASEVSTTARCLVPPMLAHRLVHTLLRLATSLHSHQEAAEGHGFNFLRRVMAHCTQQLDQGLRSSSNGCPSASFLCYYLEPLLLSFSTFSHCYAAAAATNGYLVALTLVNPAEEAVTTNSTQTQYFSLLECLKCLLQVHRKVQQAPSAGSNMSDATLLLGAIFGFILVAAHQGQRSNGSGAPVAINLSGDDEEVASALEDAIFDPTMNDDWYTSRYYQIYHRSCVDTSASSLTTTTTTATMTVGSTAGFGGTKMGEFIFALAFNSTGSVPATGWKTPLVVENPEMPRSGSGAMGVRGGPGGVDGDASRIDGSVKDLLKQLCESSFAVYFSKRRAQILQQGLGDTMTRSQAASLAAAQHQLDSASSATGTIQEYQVLLHCAERKGANLEEEVDRLRGIVDTQASQISQLTEEQDTLCGALHEATVKQAIITRALLQ